MKTVALAIMVWAMSTVTAATGQDLSYKGARLGDAKASFLEMLPDFDCTGSFCTYDLERCGAGMPGTTKESIDAYSAKRAGCRERSSFGGALVTVGSARLRNDKLVAVSLSIPKAHMPDLERSVGGRYGEATTVDETPFRTRAGATLPNWSKTWIVGSDRLILTLMSGRSDTGSAVLISQEELEASAAERAKRAQQGSKDF